jgi:hypothetical protein
MSRYTPFVLFAAFAIGGAPVASEAQGTPAGPPRTLPTVATPPAPAVAKPAAVPTDSTVALCNDGSFVNQPGTVADCASRGGLRVAMQPRPKAPVRRAGPSLSVRPPVAEQGPPAGATMRCKDGTYLSGAAAANRCADNGGMAVILPPPRPTPPAAAAPTAPMRPTVGPATKRP